MKNIQITILIVDRESTLTRNGKVIELNKLITLNGYLIA